MRIIRRLSAVFPAFFRRRWGEPLAYAVILLIGLTAFLIHFFLWVIPQLQSFSGSQNGEVGLNLVWGCLTFLFWFSLIVLGITGLTLSYRIGAVSAERKAAARYRPFPRLPVHLEYPTVPDCRLINESPGTHLAYRLPLGIQPIFPVAGLTFFSLVWNLTAWSVVFYRFWNPAENWQDQAFALFVSGMFGGLGILMLADVFRRILFAFRLGPAILEISDHPIYPGRKYRILLQQAGILRFRSFCVDVVCEEVARFRQGTDTITSRKEVYRQQLFSRNDFETTVDVPLQEEFFVQLPMEVFHSFRQENNEIAWKMEILAQMDGREEVYRECPVIVRPVQINDLLMEGGGL